MHRRPGQSGLRVLLPSSAALCGGGSAGARVSAGAATRWGRGVAGVRGAPLPRRLVTTRAVFEKFSERSIKSVMIAQQQAKDLGANEVTTEHVLLGLVQEDSAAKGGYMNSGLTHEKARAAVEALSGRRKAITGTDNIPFSREVRKTFEAATNECKRSAVTYISPEHILLAMMGQPECRARILLTSMGVDCDVLKAEAAKRVKSSSEPEAPKKKKAEKQGPRALDEFCKDLCAAVRAGKVDPVIGREREVARVMQILARRTKNNPILLGEPGVGKTAIAEGLAYAIVHRESLDGSPLPKFLETKRVLALDVGLLIAGAKERGELENRVTRLVAECKEDGDVVLMIDEVHTLVGAGAVGRGGRGGGGGGGLDVSNMIKPALARGELQCIGATTLDEHRKHIEKDPALERRFQPVHVMEPDEAATLDILAGLKERYERHHCCVYSEEALEAAVKLSHRYIADRFLPDKAIDLIDEAGSRARIDAFKARKADGRVADPRVTEYLQARAPRGVIETKDEAAKEQLYEEAGLLRRRQTDYAVQLCGPAEGGSSLPVVGVAEVEAIVSTWTGVPVERMTQDEVDRVATLGAALNARVIGQPDAVDAVASALARARCGLRDPERPVAALMFVGPTGVGKTELVRALADHYYGSQDAIVRLDMSEYMERHTVSKLIGAPPGYIGYGEGGKLTEAVRRRPCAIVLFDEIEKAHPDVFNILLQILEDGRLTDSAGRVVSFKNAMIILTSNVGSRAIAAAASAGAGGLRRRAMGGGGEEDEGEGPAQEAERALERARMRRLVHDEVKSYFRPELLNRFDEQVVFSKLGRRESRVIAGLMLRETVDRVAEKGYELEVGPALLEHILREGFSSEYGARPLRRAITAYVEDVLADALLIGRVPKGTLAYVDLDPVTRAPRCWAGRPGAAELTPVHVAGHDCGVDGEVLVTGLPPPALGFPGGAGAEGPYGGALAGDGGGDGGEVYVLASGFEEEDLAA
ncbi:MAG: ClpD chaperone, Hsp100 family [Monoraphidium minutum]|nr:MAG: ClpD chaperone, Hsp100 family [Monoraphidium minutum]